MATISEQRAKFNKMSTAQKKQFIYNLTNQLRGSNSTAHKQFLDECIQKYSAEKRGASIGAQDKSTTNTVISGDITNENLGKRIIRGYGKDANDVKGAYIAAIVLGIVGIIALIVMINVFSDTHRVGVFETVQGIRVGDIVLRASHLRIVVVAIFISGEIGYFMNEKSKFNSEISVFEKGVSGVSKGKENFELRYSEITSVSTQQEGAWSSVSIHASGKTCLVYTIKFNEIAAEINKRKNL